MVECESPWTDQDEYFTYPDCHVWAPFYTIIDVIMIISASLISVFGFSRMRFKGPKVVPFVGGLHSLCMLGVYITRTVTGFVVGSKNVVLNFFHGLAIGFIWVEISLVTLQYMEVVLLTEKLKGNTETLLERIRFGFRGISVGTFLGSIITFCFPSFIPSMHMEYAYWVMGIVGVALYTTIIWYYGFTVRNLLKSMQVSKSFYRSMVRRLDFFLMSWTFLAIPAVISIIIVLLVPVFTRNMYLLMGAMMVVIQLFNFLQLLGISPTQESKHDPTDPHHTVSHINSSVPQSAIGSQKEHGQSAGSQTEPGSILDNSHHHDTSNLSTPTLTYKNTTVVIDRLGHVREASETSPSPLPPRRLLGDSSPLDITKEVDEMDDEGGGGIGMLSSSASGLVVGGRSSNSGRNNTNIEIELLVPKGKNENICMQSSSHEELLLDTSATNRG
jgi:hypothetical protein